MMNYQHDIKEPPYEKQLKEIKLLYVEDEGIIRMDVAKYLKKRVDVLEASDGQEGFELFCKHRPDIVVTDIRMPVMDGLEMAKKIKEIDDEVPVIITTAYSDERFLIESINIGIHKYVKKPIDFKELMNIITKATRSILQHRAIHAHNRFIRTILDNSPEFFIITNGEEIFYANKSFLDFLKCNDIADFKYHYETMEQCFVRKEESFYKSRAFKEWLVNIFENQEKEYVVYMASKNHLKSEAHAYLIHANRLPEDDKYLVSFIDINQLYREKCFYYELAIRDPLTHIFNRRKFNEEMDKEINRIIRYGHTLSLMLFDIDHFKKVNDRFGHQVGDYVLQGIAWIVKESIRKIDTFARYGGEEFCIIMPETNRNSAVNLAQRLREKIEEYEFDYVEKVTCSFGPPPGLMMPFLMLKIVEETGSKSYKKVFTKTFHHLISLIVFQIIY